MANQPPVITSNGGKSTAAVSVAENTTGVTTVIGKDLDKGTVLTYSIVGGSDALQFNIDAKTGALKFINAPDFENPTDTGFNNVYDVIVGVSDGLALAQQAIAVTVTDVYEPLQANKPPTITSGNGGTSYATSIAENTTAVMQVTATSPNKNVVLTYSLAGGADASLFAIDAHTGSLSFLAPPDREHPIDAGANNVYDVTVQVSDGHLVDTQAIAVTVNNVNEAPVTTDSDAALNSVAEGATRGTLVGVTAHGVDPEGDALVYSLVLAGGATALNDGRFAIDANTGVVTVYSSAALDFETATSHAITVRASDQHGGVTDTGFTIAVTDVAPRAPVDDDPADNQVVEHSAAGTPVGIDVSSTDVNGLNGGAIAYSLSDNAGGRFQIDSTSGVVTVLDGGLLDHASATSYGITVQASDGTSASSQNFNIAILSATNVINVEQATFEFVGSFDVYDGVNWPNNPAVYSAQEAAALLYGGSPADYAISTSDSAVTHTAHYDGWGEHDSSTQIFAEDYKLDLGGPGYNDPSPGAHSARSAYVGDGISAINYVYRITSGQSNVHGTDGADQINGSAGAEVIHGGGGQDTLSGGAGADIFIWDSWTDSAAGHADLVVDFQQGVDKLSLNPLDGDLSTTLSEEDLKWAGMTSRPLAGQVGYYYDAGNNWTVIKSADPDGSGPLQPLEIHLSGQVTLTASDFLFMSGI